MNWSILYKKLTNRKHTTKYKLILTLFVLGLSFLSFSNAGSITYTGTINNQYLSSSNYFLGLGIMQSQQGCDATITCTFSTDTNSWVYIKPRIYLMLGEYNQNILDYSYGGFGVGSPYTFTKDFSTINNCSNVVGIYFQNGNPDTFNVNYTCTIEGDYILAGGGTQYTSEECQTEYDLIPSSSLTNCQNSLNSCQENTSGFNSLLNSCSNDLNACNNSLTNCLQQNCPENFTGINRSSIFINNIQYPGAPTIKFTIPQEIERDNYTDEEEMNIDVIGYGYDQEKMQQMVNTQYYKPTAEEMSGLIEKVADFMPLVAVALLIIRARRIIKKVF